MISLAIAATGGMFWLTGHYERAFWFVVLSIISGLGAVVLALVNSDWYQAKRSQAVLEIDFFNSSKGVGGLILTKVITTSILGWCAWKLGHLADYFTRAETRAYVRIFEAREEVHGYGSGH